MVTRAWASFLEIRIKWPPREAARPTSDASMLGGRRAIPRDETGQLLLATQTGGE
jgi:hypothetical protein